MYRASLSLDILLSKLAFLSLLVAGCGGDSSEAGGTKEQDAAPAKASVADRGDAGEKAASVGRDAAAKTAVKNRKAAAPADAPSEDPQTAAQCDALQAAAQSGAVNGVHDGGPVLVWKVWTNEQWAGQLKHPLLAVRAEALSGIISTTQPDARRVALLLPALEDPHPQIRREAAKHLGHLGEHAEAAIVPLGRLLDDAERTVREAAATALLYLRSNPDLLQPLLQPLMAGLERPGIRAECIGMLGEIGPPARVAVPKIIAALRDHDSGTRAAAAWALGQVRAEDETVVASLAPLLHERDKRVRGEATRALAVLGPRAKAVTDRLLAISPEADAALKGQTAIQNVEYSHLLALARIAPEDPRVLELFEQALESDHRFVRYLAGLATARLAPSHPRAVELLADAASRGSIEADVVAQAGEAIIPRMDELLEQGGRGQNLAAQVLARIPASYTAARLEKLFELSADGVHINFGQPLEQLGEQLAPALAALLSHDDHVVRLAAIWTLYSLGPKAAVARPELTAALNDPVPEVRFAAAGTIITLAPEHGLAAVPEALESVVAAWEQHSTSLTRRPLTADEEPQRQSPLWLLGEVAAHEQAAVDQLADLIQSDDESMRHMAMITLVEVGARAAPALLKLVEHPDQQVRHAAVIALSHLGPAAKPAAPVFLDYLDADDEELRNAAIRALIGLGADAAETAPVLVKMIRNQQGTAAVAILPAIGEPALPAVIPLLSHNDEIVRMIALLVLHEMGPLAREAMPETAKMPAFDGGDRLSRAEIGSLYVEEGPKLRINTMLRLAQDPEEFAREIHADERAEWRSPGGDVEVREPPIIVPDAALPLLVQHVEDYYDGAWAANLLAHAAPRTKPFLPRLTRLLDLERGDRINHALTVIGSLGEDARSLSPKLVELTRRPSDDDSISDVRRHAWRALAQVDPDRALAEFRSLLDKPIGSVEGNLLLQEKLPELKRQAEAHADPNRWVAVEAMRHLRPTAGPAVPYLIQSLTDPDRLVRKTAAEVLLDQPLAIIAPHVEKSADVLLKAIAPVKKDGDYEYEVRNAASRALTCLGPKVAGFAPKLIDQATDQHIGAFSPRTVLASGGQLVLPMLIKLLSHEDPVMRHKAMMTLQEMGGQARDALPALEQARLRADDEWDLELINEAIDAIRKEVDPDAVPPPEEQVKHLLSDGRSDHPQLPSDGAALREFLARFTELMAAALKSENAPTRRKAAEALANVPQAIEGLAEPLLEAADDSKPSVRAAVLPALARHYFYEAFPRLIRALSDEDSLVRFVAAEELDPLAPPVRADDVPDLIRALKAEPIPQLESARVPDPREVAVKLLARIGPEAKAAIPALLALADATPERRHTSIPQALAAMRSRGVPALVEALGSDSLRRRTVAAQACQRLGPVAQPAEVALRTAAFDLTHDHYRPFAAALSELNLSDQTSRGLARLLAHENEEYRSRAADVFNMLMQRREFDPSPLIEVLVGDNAEAAREAARLLSLHGIRKPRALSDQAIAALAGFLEPDEYREVAEHILRRLGPDAKAAVDPLEQIIKGKSRPAAIYAAGVLAGVGPQARSATGSLVELLKSLSASGDAEPRSYGPRLFPDGRGLDDEETVVQALTAIGDPAAVVALAPRFGDEEQPEFHRMVYPFFIGLGPRAKAALPRLITVLKEGRASYRSDAAHAILAIGSEASSAVEALTQALSDSQPFVRKTAARALGAIGPAAAPSRPELTRLAGAERFPSIRSAAQDALQEVGK